MVGIYVMMGSTFNIVWINRGMVASPSRTQMMKTHFFHPFRPSLRFLSRVTGLALPSRVSPPPILFASHMPTPYQKWVWEREVYINWSMVKLEKVESVTGTTLRITDPVPVDGRQ